ncbi:MAG: PadR family transcriptional regulator [Chloroflexota bacterium]|nr:PadR family transcriptional regulator [Chloroflexota bacterium]
MSVKHALLGILAQAPRHGYDLKRAFDDKLGDFWNLNVGQIYTTLSRLEADELIQHDAVEQDDKPDKKVYRLTPAGHAEFADWRTRALKPEPRNLRDELFVRILFMEADDTDAVLSVVGAQQGVYLKQMMQLTDRKFCIEQAARRDAASAPTPEARQAVERESVLQLILIDVALLHAEADIRWLRQCETRIKSLFRTNGGSHEH